MAIENTKNISILNANRQDVADEESVRQLEYIEKAKNNLLRKIDLIRNLYFASF